MSEDTKSHINITSVFPWVRKWSCHNVEENAQPIATIQVSDGSFKTVTLNPATETSSSKKMLQKIPARFMFSVLGFFGLLNCYIMRVNMNVAMVAMVKSPTGPNSESVHATSEVCIELYKNSLNKTSTMESQRGEFEWDYSIQHLILASFYITYMLFQIPLGVVAEKYYSKHFFGAGVLITSIFTLLTPIAARYSVVALIMARAVQGFGQAAMWPAMNALIGRWIPVMERSRASSFIYNGCAVGLFIGFSLSGVLCDSTIFGGWPSVFYIFGIFGCAWCLLWMFLVYETPESHPYITKSELIYIRKDQQEINNQMSIPWKSILTSVPFWSLVVVHFGQDWAYHTLLTEMPIYLSNVMHFELKNNGFLSALPNVVSAIVACLASVFADKLREKGMLKINPIRKIFNSIGFYIPGLCIVSMAFVGCAPVLIVVLLTLTLGINGFVYSGLFSTHVDMSPDFAGTLMAISNSIGNIPGFLSPIVTGWILKSGNTFHNWSIVFITSASFLIVCGTIYNIFCSAKLQNWSSPSKTSSEQVDENLSVYRARNTSVSWPARKFSISVN